jgi:putative two-component system response regulator
MTGKRKILIIEGDTPMAMRMVCFLTGANCEVQSVRTAEAGMQLALETKFHLIVLDVDLHGGLDICRELKQRHFTRHTPVVFISELSSLEDQQQGLDAGAADYITKPFDTSDFVQRILSAIKSPNALNVSDERADTDADSFCDAAQGNQ